MQPPSSPASASDAPTPTIPAPDAARPFLRPLRAILDDLKKPVPPRLIATKKTGKFTADFIAHPVVRDLLDHYAPGWTWSVQIVHAAEKLYVIGTLTLHGADGQQARDGIGNADDDLDGYGDPSSNAEAQALRRAAMAHGLARDLWRK